MSRWFLVVTAVAMAAAVGGAPAGASVVEREHYSFTEEFSDAPCGYPLDVVFTVEGKLVIRSEDGEAFRVKDTYSFRSVFTNPENGRWFVIRGHATIHDVKSTHVEGTIYEFVVNEAGQPLVLEDSEGNVIARDRGNVRHTVLFDTLGDGEPGGEILDEADPDLRGQFPTFDEDFSFCESVDELVGA
jgi:hypothetical protein